MALTLSVSLAYRIVLLTHGDYIEVRLGSPKVPVLATRMSEVQSTTKARSLDFTEERVCLTLLPIPLM